MFRMYLGPKKLQQLCSNLVKAHELKNYQNYFYLTMFQARITEPFLE